VDELTQELRRSALSNDLGFGAGFHVYSVLDGASSLQNMPLGQVRLKAWVAAERFYRFMRLLVYKLSNTI
jgi:hypothetical protein